MHGVRHSQQVSGPPRKAARALPTLAAELFGLLDSFRPARVALFDFHFRSRVEDYVAAIQQTSGRRVLITADNHADGHRRVQAAPSTRLPQQPSDLFKRFRGLLVQPIDGRSPALPVFIRIDSEVPKVLIDSRLRRGLGGMTRQIS